MFFFLHKKKPKKNSNNYKHTDHGSSASGMILYFSAEMIQVQHYIAKTNCKSFYDGCDFY